ncbi:MAG: HD domain-containing phosphohydrolase [Acidimicrobiales bacterium]
MRLAELVGALSLAVDLGLGQPMEHMARACLIATRLGDTMGLDEQERAALYYVTLLGWVGCIADSREAAATFGDDIAYRADYYDLDMKPLPFLGYILRNAGAGKPVARRIGTAATLVATGARAVQDSLRAHCQVTTGVARRLGLGPEVCEPLRQLFVRWDGKGLPRGVGGAEIPLVIRLWHLADLAEVHHGRGGTAASVDAARERSGGQLAPDVVEAFCDCADDLLDRLPDGSSWDDLIDAEPALRPVLSQPELDAALEVIADYADLKSPHCLGHSRGVADLAATAGQRLGMGHTQVRTLRRAALVHDLGRLGVPNSIWDKPGRLTTAQHERVRLHSYYTERMLARPPALAEFGEIAAMTHERLDRSGYHRGLPAAAIPLPARVLAAADTYHAMLEPRPHRAPIPDKAAAHTLEREAGAGRLDRTAVTAVLAAGGHRMTRRPAGPAGLTPREVEVLVLLARGCSNRQIARRLGIKPKTAGNHIERIYTKAGVSTRAAATLFAMQQGLLRTLEPLE